MNKDRANIIYEGYKFEEAIGKMFESYLGRRCFSMNIFEVKDGCPLKGKTEQMTEEELQREYDFHIAESIIANLYKEGKITVDELHKISALNRQKFSPRLAEIMS